ncbi:MAG TPA: glycosyltransferase family 4 protein [Firmicutes bacterium]|nr:glycosyltransferase family 4 protein [Bacillota bacterium]
MGIVIIGPVFDATGYAEVVRNIAFGLDRMGIEVRLEPRSLSLVTPVFKASVESSLRRMAGNKSVVPKIALHIFLAGFFQPIPGLYNIGFSMIEVDRLPSQWVERCNLMNEVWVPSSFNLEVFSASGVHRGILKVMPLGIDVGAYCPHGLSLEVKGLRGFVFLSVFEWILRKGYDLLLRAFCEEFEPNEDVTLLLRVHDNSKYDPHGRKIRENIRAICHLHGRDDRQIIVLSSILPADLMPALYRTADCFVLPTRGEGWNMPAMEAMACGLPVISTKWSGQMEFMQHAPCYLIDIEGLEPVPMQGIPNDSVYAGANWARPSVSHLRRLMRHVFENREEAREIGRRASDFVRSHYSWDISVGRICNRLKEVDPHGMG